jgi:hypothetical protein
MYLISSQNFKIHPRLGTEDGVEVISPNFYQNTLAYFMPGGVVYHWLQWSV